MLRRIVSGGQSGVDRAALDAARALGLPAGGWCPRGRLAEDGCIRRRYRLAETPSYGYAQRTAWNVRDSGATLVINRGRLEGGTRYTVGLARHFGRPLYYLVLGRRVDRGRWRAWLRRHRVRVLNIAGPRESKRPGIYRQALRLLTRLLSASSFPLPVPSTRKGGQINISAAARKARFPRWKC